MNEISLASGRKDPEAEATKFRVVDITDRLTGFESIDQTLSQAAIGYGFSPQSVAPRTGKRPIGRVPVLDTRDKEVNSDR
ncbi:MAG: hypothetical protein OXN84_06320 [Albidovulum sp.]|nr:hypothetical protein [Albidovulum sp.]